MIGIVYTDERLVRVGSVVSHRVYQTASPVHLPALLVTHLGVGSTSEARRLIGQGGVKVDGEPVADLDLPRARLEGALIQAGKRRFMRFRAA